MQQNYPLPFSRPHSQIQGQPPGSNSVGFDLIYPVDSSRMVVVEHLERRNTAISSPPKAVRASDAGLIGRI